jgi:hypothetical protein
LIPTCRLYKDLAGCGLFIRQTVYISSCHSLQIELNKSAIFFLFTRAHHICTMLKAAFCRPSSFFPVLTRNCARNLQRIHIASRSSFRLFTTTSVLCDTKRVADTSKATGSGANEYCSSDAPNLRKSSLFDLETLRTHFRELSDRSLIAVRQRADDFTAKTESAFSLVGSHLNRVTGYEEIETLKRRVVDQGVYASLT